MERSPSFEDLLARADAPDLEQALAALQDMAEAFRFMATGPGAPAPAVMAPPAPPVTAPGEGILTIDGLGFIHSFNPAAEQIFGMPAEEAVGRPAGSLFGRIDGHADAAGPLAIGPWCLPSSGGPMHVAGRRRDGSTFSAELTSAELRIGGELRFILVVRDVTELLRSDAERRKAEARFRSLVEQIPAVTFMGELHADGHEFYVSPHIEALLGFTQEEWLSDPFLWFKQLHPEDRELCHREFARGCRTGGPFRAEFRALTRAGDIVWIHGEARMVRDESGRPMFIQGVAYDITDLKRAEEAIRASAEQLRSSLAEKEILLKEIHHRVKNNLQVISSLLRLQSSRLRTAPTPEMFHESQNRIRSMALVHEKLYQSAELSRIDFRSYVKSLAALLLRSYGERTGSIAIKAQVQDVLLNVTLAVPLGLIVNELVSNALKHAFPEGRGGEIRIDLTAPEPGRYRLSIADDGVGLPGSIDWNTTETLGLQLVRTLTEQIGGALERREGSGTGFTITFPEPS